jgi:hypothetical protein
MRAHSLWSKIKIEENTLKSQYASFSRATTRGEKPSLIQHTQGMCSYHATLGFEKYDAMLSWNSVC